MGQLPILEHLMKISSPLYVFHVSLSHIYNIYTTIFLDILHILIKFLLHAAGNLSG